MNSDKICMYARFSNYKDMLGDNVIIYVYAKTQDLVDTQLNYIKDFCYNNNIKVSSIYIDMECPNKLKDKYNLQKMIKDNPNSTVLISNTDRLCRGIFDYLEIKNQKFNNNVEFFNITTNNFEFNVTIDFLNELAKYKEIDNDIHENIDVLLVEPNKLPVKKTIKNTLEEKQKLVGGLIEYTYLPYFDDVAIICNEEGKLLGLPVNRDIGHDIITGNFIIVADDPEQGEDKSLTEEQIKKYTEYFGKESIKQINKKVNEIFINKDISIK